MKKSFVLFITLLCLAMIVVCYGQISILAERDQVQLTENVLFGDKTVVEGVNINLKNTYDSRLYWDTSYTIGKEPEISTEYRFYQGRQSEPYYRYDGDMSFYQDYIHLSYWDNEIIPQPSDGLDAAMQELYEETGNAERREKTILVKDYLEYYHFAVDISSPHNSTMETSPFHINLVKEELESDITYGVEHHISEQEVDAARKYLKWIETFQAYKDTYLRK